MKISYKVLENASNKDRQEGKNNNNHDKIITKKRKIDISI